MIDISETIVGESEAIRRLRALVLAAAPTMLSVLIEGPTGSGKELVAGALHHASGRRGRLVSFNVCAIADSMFEDALFGHARGAFTGAFADTPGFLREADGGTAFFDEISGLPMALQAKLLRAIETGQFRPVGARADARSDFRVVAATNERLDLLAAAHRFRTDLAHRVGGIVVYVPPLADRLDDVPLLVSAFLRQIGSAHLGITSQALRLLCEHDWPGNVRELKQVVQWAAALADTALDAGVVATALSHRSHSPDTNNRVVERRLLCDTLERAGWNTELAARELGIHRATIYRRMKRLQVTLRRRDPERPFASDATIRGALRGVAVSTGEPCESSGRAEDAS